MSHFGLFLIDVVWVLCEYLDRMSLVSCFECTSISLEVDADCCVVNLN